MLTLMKQECTTKNGWSMREKFQNILAKKPLKLSKIVNLGKQKKLFEPLYFEIFFEFKSLSFNLYIFFNLDFF